MNSRADEETLSICGLGQSRSDGFQVWLALKRLACSTKSNSPENSSRRPIVDASVKLPEPFWHSVVVVIFNDLDLKPFPKEASVQISPFHECIVHVRKSP